MTRSTCTEQPPSYFEKIKALGFSIVRNEPNHLIIAPLRTSETWNLKLFEENWVLYVNETPQISFQPEEVIRFLIHRKFPAHAQKIMSASQ